MKEQSGLEQQAKRHLEEELRSDIEEKEHIIEALKTKVTLLKVSWSRSIPTPISAMLNVKNNIRVRSEPSPRRTKL